MKQLTLAGDQTASLLPANSSMTFTAHLYERIGFVFSLDYVATRRHRVFGIIKIFRTPRRHDAPPIFLDYRAKQPGNSFHRSPT